MKFTINYKRELDKSLLYLLEKLPIHIGTSISKFCEENGYPVINEIRMKKNSFIYLIADSKNVKTNILISNEDIEDIVESITDGSLYAHVDTIKEGYISVGNGIRAGICGTAVLENNSILGIKDISSINIRLPQKILNASNFVYSLLHKSNFDASILIYSPPGVGKTSILRDLILKLNDTNKRFSVIDSRDEIITPFLNSISCDTFISYPKGLAIEMATKSMTPEIIICDEISTEKEADAILKASHNGVKFIATTHASSYEELQSKVIFSKLISSGIFNYFVGVSRGYGEKAYKFSLTKHKNEALVWKLSDVFWFFCLQFYARITMNDI